MIDLLMRYYDAFTFLLFSTFRLSDLFFHILDFQIIVFRFSDPDSDSRFAFRFSDFLHILRFWNLLLFIFLSSSVSFFLSNKVWRKRCFFELRIISNIKKYIYFFEISNSFDLKTINIHLNGQVLTTDDITHNNKNWISESRIWKLGPIKIEFCKIKTKFVFYFWVWRKKYFSMGSIFLESLCSENAENGI